MDLLLLKVLGKTKFYFLFKKNKKSRVQIDKKAIFAPQKMVVVAQLVRASVCGTEGRRFETGLPPQKSCSVLNNFFYSQ